MPAKTWAQEGRSDVNQVEKLLSSAPSSSGAELPGLRQFTLGDPNWGPLLWVTLGTAASLFLLAPGLALFYRGLAGTGHSGGALADWMFLGALLSLTWVLWQYSLAFSRNEHSHDVLDREVLTSEERFTQGNRFIGGTKHMALRGLDSSLQVSSVHYPLRRVGDPVPHLSFMAFQLGMFLSAAAPLAVFLVSLWPLSRVALFLVLWGTIVYAPIAYWVWGGGWQAAALDYSGGIVVHVTAGFSALALICLKEVQPGGPLLVARLDDPSVVVPGAAMVWAAALLSSGAHALLGSGSGISAALSTHLAACTGIVGWFGSEWLSSGTTSRHGIAAGALAGLVAIASGSGYVAPQSALLIGIAGGAVCQRAFRAVTRGPRGLSFPALFSIQGVGAALGVVLTGVFATSSVGGFDRHGDEVRGLLSGNPEQVATQVTALVSAASLAFAGTYVCGWVVRALRPVGQAPASRGA